MEIEIFFLPTFVFPSFCPAFNHLFHDLLLAVYCIPGPRLGARSTEVKQTQSCP